jgi:hypothetical protein
MAIVTHIGVLFSAKLVAILMAFVGLLAGVLYAGIGAIYDALRGPLNIGTALAFMAIIGMPLLFAVFGFIAGGIGAFLYNLFARWFGGIEIEMDFTQGM